MKILIKHIQMKMLNTGKRDLLSELLRTDKALYAMTMKHTVERQENLTPSVNG